MSILICSWQFLTLLAVMVAVSFWGFFANHDCRETERYRERHRKNSKFRDLELQMGLKTVLCCHWGASGFEGDVHGWGGQIIIIKSPGRATSEEAPNSWEILTLEVLLVIVLLQLLLQLYCKAGWEGSHLFPSNSIWHPTGNFEGYCFALSSIALNLLFVANAMNYAWWCSLHVLTLEQLNYAMMMLSSRVSIGATEWCMMMLSSCVSIRAP